jgi:hypothetical protein
MMTKEQFLNGVEFRVAGPTYKGDWTFKFDEGAITRQTRSFIDNKVMLEGYECNISKIGRIGFEGFAYVMGKRVNIKFKFKDLIIFDPTI